MTTAADLIEELKGKGVTLKVVGDRLRFHPRSAVTVDDLARLRDHKKELLVLLKLSCASFLEIPTPHTNCIGRDDVFSRANSVNVNKTSTIPANTQVSLTTAPGDTRKCPACGSARIAPGKRRLWCLYCERDIWAADDPQGQPKAEAIDWLESIGANGRTTWTRADVAALEVVDCPSPCKACGALDGWQDLEGSWHCERCEPRTDGPRLRTLARRLRLRYGLSATDPHATAWQAERGNRTTRKQWSSEVPDSIAADTCPACSDCGRPVIPGQMHRFLTTGRGISIDTMDRIGAALRLRLVQDSDE